MNIIDFEAEKKWRNIPEEFRERVVNNVFCSKCFVTTIVDYTVSKTEYGILLKGKCKKCGKDVARAIEDD